MLDSHTSHSFNNALLTAVTSVVLLGFLAIAALPPVRAVAAQQQQSQSQPKSKSKSQPKSNPKSNPGSNPSSNPAQLPNPTDQQSGVDSKGLPQVKADTPTIQTILEIAFGFIGAFALFSVTASGFKYITSAGNPQKTSEAKSGVVYAIVGLMLAITAEAIVAFVIHWGAPQ